MELTYLLSHLVVASTYIIQDRIVNQIIETAFYKNNKGQSNHPTIADVEMQLMQLNHCDGV